MSVPPWKQRPHCTLHYSLPSAPATSSILTASRTKRKISLLPLSLRDWDCTSETETQDLSYALTFPYPIFAKSRMSHWTNRLAAIWHLHLHLPLSLNANSKFIFLLPMWCDRRVLPLSLHKIKPRNHTERAFVRSKDLLAWVTFFCRELNWMVDETWLHDTTTKSPLEKQKRAGDCAKATPWKRKVCVWSAQIW